MLLEKLDFCVNACFSKHSASRYPFLFLFLFLLTVHVIMLSIIFIFNDNPSQFMYLPDKSIVIFSRVKINPTTTVNVCVFISKSLARAQLFDNCNNILWRLQRPI
jgi:hypothetical protein